MGDNPPALLTQAGINANRLRIRSLLRMLPR